MGGGGGGGGLRNRCCGGLFLSTTCRNILSLSKNLSGASALPSGSTSSTTTMLSLALLGITKGFLFMEPTSMSGENTSNSDGNSLGGTEALGILTACSGEYIFWNFGTPRNIYWALFCSFLANVLDTE